MFHNFRRGVRRSQLKVSWTHPRGEDNHDVKGLDHRIGIRVPARLPGPYARRQRARHRADHEHPGRQPMRLSVLGVTPGY